MKYEIIYAVCPICKTQLRQIINTARKFVNFCDNCGVINNPTYSYYYKEAIKRFYEEEIKKKKSEILKQEEYLKKLKEELKEIEFRYNKFLKSL